MANINELIEGFSFGQQQAIVGGSPVPAIANPQIAANIWRQTNLNTKPWAKMPINEDDKAEIGKGHEFATQLFKSHYQNPDFEISKYCSSQFIAWVMAFSLGNTTLSGSAPYTYTTTPALGSAARTLGGVSGVQSLELPYFTHVQQIRPGGSAILDEAKIGCAVRSWKLSIKNSPGRASAMISATCACTGQYVAPSTITLPAATLLNEFNAGTITALSFNGVNYMSGASASNFVSLDASWDNNFRPGYFPGSGNQDGYQIQGRLEFGDRTFSVQYVVRVAAGSPEYGDLIALTTGTSTVTFLRDSNNSFTMLIQKMAFQTAELSNTDGIVTLQITGSQLYDPINGLVTMTTVTPQNGICQ
jgi:hypothetical protein